MTRTLKLTARQEQALKIVQKGEEPGVRGIRPSAFAHSFWPADHPGWSKLMRGRNSVNKNFLYLQAGSYLGRLFHLGLLQTSYHPEDKTLTYVISVFGERALKTKQYKAPEPRPRYRSGGQNEKS